MDKPLVNWAAKRRKSRQIDAARRQTGEHTTSRSAAGIVVRDSTRISVIGGEFRRMGRGLVVENSDVKGHGLTFRETGVAIDATDSDLNLSDIDIQ